MSTSFLQPSLGRWYACKHKKHTHPFNGPLSGTTQVGRYQKGKTNLDFAEARDSEWQWHQLDHMQVCTSLQRDNHAVTPSIKFFTGRVPFLPPNQQCQSTEGKHKHGAEMLYIFMVRYSILYVPVLKKLPVSQLILACGTKKQKSNGKKTQKKW